MLIRLLPADPMPTVLFTLAPTHPPQHLPLPNSYAATLQAVADHSLEQPSSFHALDRASWPLALLDDVLFDLNSLSISVTWIDGLVNEWPVSQALEAMLHDVVSYVKKSEAASEREKIPAVVVAPTPPSQPVTATTDEPYATGGIGKERTKGKQKRQRNLIMNLVA